MSYPIIGNAMDVPTGDVNWLERFCSWQKQYGAPASLNLDPTVV
jgi:hypothetical protein